MWGFAMNNIKSKLRNFKLAGMASSLEERLLYANNNKLDYQEFLDMLCDDEENNRRDNSYRKRYAKAKISSHKSLKDFDFAFQPSIDEKKVNDPGQLHEILLTFFRYNLLVNLYSPCSI